MKVEQHKLDTKTTHERNLIQIAIFLPIFIDLRKMHESRLWPVSTPLTYIAVNAVDTFIQDDALTLKERICTHILGEQSRPRFRNKQVLPKYCPTPV